MAKSSLTKSKGIDCKKVISTVVLVALLVFASIEFSTRVFYAIKLGQIKLFFYPFYHRISAYRIHRLNYPNNHLQGYSKYQPNSEIQTYIKDAKTDRFHLYSIPINRLGYRGKELKEDKIKVVLLGESSSFGAFLKEEDTLSYQLENHLNHTSSQKKFSVLNMAVSGSNTNWIPFILKNEIKKLKPDYILFAGGHNDIKRTLYNGLTFPIPPLENLSEISFWPNKWWLNYSIAFRTSKIVISRLKKIAAIQLDQLTAPVFNRYLGNLDELIKYAKESNTKLILLKQRLKIKDHAQKLTYDQYIKSLAKQKTLTVFQFHTLALYRLTQKLKADPPHVFLFDTTKILDFHDDDFITTVHPNGKINEILAIKLAKTILQIHSSK